MKTCGLPAVCLFSVAAAGQSCPPAWSTEVGTPGTSAVIRCLTVFDDGSGRALYAGGPFFTAGGVTVNSVAKWDGAGWSALGTGCTGPIPTIAAAVNGLGVYDDGTGPGLYAAGNLLTAGGVPANRIARWDGNAWSALGTGCNQGAQALCPHDDGTGNQLYVGGSFTSAGSLPGTVAIARWDGTQWSAVGDGFAAGSVNVLLEFDDGSGPRLYAGGTFTTSGSTMLPCIAVWDGAAWGAVSGGFTGAVNPVRVNALAVYDDGGGERLYAGGLFSGSGATPLSNIARLGASGWEDTGGGTSDNVIRMAVYDDGSGPGLYLGGAFFSAGATSPVTVNQVARWDGSWHDLAGGVLNTTITTVSGLAVVDDGSGESLFVAGGFTTAGGMSVGNIARWGCLPAPCYADCNGDGALNLSDFGCFTTQFALGDPYADCNGDSSLNLSDFGCFQTKFALGCP
ncbi:MAG: hypothetical protein IT437_13660 [Phycisphaerales bacterium]|nr:hypothetical protein [Phycisphaerales bacterium]